MISVAAAATRWATISAQYFESAPAFHIPPVVSQPTYERYDLH